MDLIRSEIIRVISKSNERAAGVRFEITSTISDKNGTNQSSITTLMAKILIAKFAKQWLLCLSFSCNVAMVSLKKTLQILLVVLFYCPILIG